MSKSTYLLKLPTSVKTNSKDSRSMSARLRICRRRGAVVGARADESEDGGMPLAEA
jgi:hypothetical protein